jgi:hypothetical protein
LAADGRETLLEKRIDDDGAINAFFDKTLRAMDILLIRFSGGLFHLLDIPLF